MKSIALPCLAICVALSAVRSAAAITFGPDFAADYTYFSLGMPSGVPTPLGGLTLKYDDPNTLLIGGDANEAGGAIYAIGLTRDLDGHITGFSGSATLYATAPQIDGGLAYGPGNTLFYTGFPGNVVGQILPGSNSPDRTEGVGGLAYNYGSLMFVPAGFPGAGSLKLVSFNSGEFGTAPLSPLGGGLYDVGDVPTVEAILPGGPEGMVYVASGNDGFPDDSMLVAEYTSGAVGAYQIDGSGNPIVGTRRDFLTDLTSVEGAFVDPLTGDFLFSQFTSGHQVYVVRGFIPLVPEPTSMMLIATLLTAVASVGRWRRR